MNYTTANKLTPGTMGQLCYIIRREPIFLGDIFSDVNDRM